MYEVVPASILHVRPLAKRMRAASAASVAGYGFNPREGLRRSFVNSHHCRTALVDGRPIAMWGLIGPLLAGETFAWVVLTEEAAEIPFSVVREARRALATAAESYETVRAAIFPDDAGAIRFATFMGFVEDGRAPLGDSYVLSMRYLPHRVLEEAA